MNIIQQVAGSMRRTISRSYDHLVVFQLNNGNSRLLQRTITTGGGGGGVGRSPPFCPSGCRSVSTSSTASKNRSTQQRVHDDPQQIQKDYAYCVNLVRERDREGYLCGLLMPKAAQRGYFAIRAFNVEIASIKDGHHARRGGSGGTEFQQQQSSSTSSISASANFALKLRMQWWREAIEKIYADNETESSSSSSWNMDPNIAAVVRNLSESHWHSPIVRSLAVAQEQHQLTRRFLERLVDARELDLSQTQYRTVNDMAAYAEDCMASVLYLSLECTGTRNASADRAASHAGVGIGLTTALRSTPYRLLSSSQREISIPAELLRPDYPLDHLVEEFARAAGAVAGSENNNATDAEEDETNMLLSQADKEELQEAVRYMANVAMAELQAALQEQGNVPSSAKPCLLPVIPALHYLEQLQQVNFQLWHPAVLQHNHDPKRQLKLLFLLGRTWLTGVF